MKHTKRKLTLLSALLGLISLAMPAMAQSGKVDLDKPKFDALPSPEFGGNTGKKNFKPKDWLEAEVKFKVAMPASYKPKFVDRVTVKWYVAAKNPEGSGYVLLEKEVNYINVPVGEEIYASIYLSPSSLMRLSGKDRASKSSVSHVGGEIMVNGSPAVNKSGYFSSKGKAGWWTSGKLSRYDKVPLKNKNETPFKNLWWDRYGEIEERR